MRYYFNLVSSHHTIIDNEGLEVADVDEARTFAREAVAEMVQDGVSEIAHWRGWELEARDASGTVLFTVYPVSCSSPSSCFGASEAPG
ncbi:MAG: DUF6894 family protein [Microvirga sp.]